MNIKYTELVLNLRYKEAVKSENNSDFPDALKKYQEALYHCEIMIKNQTGSQLEIYQGKQDEIVDKINELNNRQSVSKNEKKTNENEGYSKKDTKQDKIENELINDDAKSFEGAIANGTVLFKDVIGLDEAKEVIKDQVVNKMKNPKIYEKFGLDINLKLLLYGPPGTGKTFFARAVAGELNIPFINVNINSLINSYIGATGKNINELFESAKKRVEDEGTPVVLFFDEFDHIAENRNSENKTAGEAVGALLTKLDGFADNAEKIIIIAATNRLEIMDKAILDRFNTALEIGLPTEADREKMMRQHLNKKIKSETVKESVNSEIDFVMLANETAGLSGRSISQAMDKFLTFLASVECKTAKLNVSMNDKLLEFLKEQIEKSK